MMRSTMPEDDVLRSSEESPDDVSTKAGRQHAPPQPLEGRSPRDRSGHGNHDEPIIDIEHIVSNGAGTVELSVIEEGRSYARITYDDATAEHMYEVVEPRLNEDELAAFELLKKALIISLNAPSDPSPEHRRKMLDKAVDRLTSTLGLTLRPVSRERILYHLHRDFIGYGPITVMMADPDIEDISCNGVGVPLFVYHRKYGSIRTNVIYEDEAELDRYVIWLAQRCGKHISLARPMLDATIPDGSRLNATLGRHVTKRGSSFTIRRFKDDPFTPVDLIGFNTMSTEMMAYLWISVEFGSSMMVCGGTASGKTTVARAVLEAVGASQIAYLPHDAYYKDRDDLTFAERARLNYDHPDSLDTKLLVRHIKDLLVGASVHVPVYDFTTDSRTEETILVEPSPIILVDGILIFTKRKLRDGADRVRCRHGHPGSRIASPARSHPAAGRARCHGRHPRPAAQRRTLRTADLARRAAADRAAAGNAGGHDPHR